MSNAPFWMPYTAILIGTLPVQQIVSNASRYPRLAMAHCHIQKVYVGRGYDLYRLIPAFTVSVIRAAEVQPIFIGGVAVIQDGGFSSGFNNPREAAVMGLLEVQPGLTQRVLRPHRAAAVETDREAIELLEHIPPVSAAG